MTIKDAVLAYMSASSSGVTDSDLRQALGVKHHAQVNQRCRELASAGLIVRRQEEDGIRNYFVASPAQKPQVAATVISDRPWFWEGNVQAAVVRHLVKEGFDVVRVADTSSREHGKDIVVARTAESSGLASRESRLELRERRHSPRLETGSTALSSRSAPGAERTPRPT